MASQNHLGLAGLLLAATFILLVAIVAAQNTTFSFSPFSTADQSSFLMVDDAQFDSDNHTFLMNLKAGALRQSSCGRLLYKDKVRVKDSASGAVASFHTAFTFQITGDNLYYYPNYGVVHADGLAFTFAKTNSSEGVEPGSSMCLLKEQQNATATNPLFAVEFDTFLNYWLNDPSDGHIGVNVNSMNSTWYYNLCGGSVRNCTYLCNGGYFTAWIDYNSGLQSLQVFFAKGSLVNSIAKPPKPLILASLSLRELFDDYMYVGFSASTGLFGEVHYIQSWMFTSSGMPELAGVLPLSPAPSPGIVLIVPNSTSSSRSSTVGIIAGVSGGGVAALLVVALICITRYRRRRSSRKGDSFELVDPNLSLRMFTYKELSKATKSFNKSEVLGSGGFGAVYKGTLPSGALVAVKRMRMESKHGVKSFQAEVTSLCHIRHRNLVQLLGWCNEEEELLLVYDHMCNGSLNKWLFHFAAQNGYNPLPLPLRYSVLSGVAAALCYLHEECAQCVLHRDIKSSNVLLDGDWNAYLGDFGLARVVNHQKMEKTTMMAGTLGYMAPEMLHTGKATKESDVYSFGVLMLEVMCGAPVFEVSAVERGEGVLVDRVWRAHGEGKLLEVAEPRLELEAFPPPDQLGTSGGYEATFLFADDVDPSVDNKKTIANLLHLGLLCCNPNPNDRPRIRLVSQLLQTSENMEMYLPPLPDLKPQGCYSAQGFRQEPPEGMSWSSWTSSAAKIQHAAEESSASNHMLASFCAPESSVFSGC